MCGREVTSNLAKTILIFGPIFVEIFISVESFLNDGPSVDTFDIDRSLQHRMGLDLVQLLTVKLPDLAAILAATGAINCWEKEKSNKM